jgi:hypothetical protein
VSPAVPHKLLPFSLIGASPEDESPRCQPADLVCFPTSTLKSHVAGEEFALLAGQHSYLYSSTDSMTFVKLVMRAAWRSVFRKVATARGFVTTPVSHSVVLTCHVVCA